MKKTAGIFLGIFIALSPGFISPCVCAQTQMKETTPHKKALSDAEQVKETLRNLEEAFVDQNIDEMARYIHKNATSFDDAFDETFKGKEAVLNHIKQRFKRFAPKGKSPLLSMDIGQPKITVKGKKAVANYVVFSEIGGARPHELSSEVTEEFVKEDGQWLSYKYYCHWTEENRKYLESGLVNPKHYVKLRGGVKTLLVSLHGIKALGNDVRKADRGLNEYTREASRKKLVVMASGNIVGPIIEESKSPQDYLPARKEHLSLYLNELTSLIKLMKADVDALESGALTLIIRKDIRKELDSLIDLWVSKVKAADRDCKALNRVTKMSIENNALLVEKAKVLESDLDELRKIQKKMIRAFRKPISSPR